MPGVRNADRVILLAIALCIPTITKAFDSAISPTSALERFAIALALCWAAGAIIERLIDNYSRQARQAEIVQRLQKITAAHAATMNKDHQAMSASRSATAPPG